MFRVVTVVQKIMPELKGDVVEEAKILATTTLFNLMKEDGK
jgi:hypothetical protein